MLAPDLRVVMIIIDAMPHRHVDPVRTPRLWQQVTTGGRAPDGGTSLPMSVTYANHAAFVTGADPATTGVYGNHTWIDGEGWVSAPKTGPRAPTLFDLVADVERYPEFLPWCSRASVTEVPGEGSARTVEATLTMSKGPLRKSFTTRNRQRRADRIDMRLVEGPFKRLGGGWRFTPLAVGGAPAVAGGSEVALQLEFEMQSGITRRVLEPLFGEIAGAMVDAFKTRAGQLYGRADG